MELEFKCNTKSCNFSAEVDWPERVIDGRNLGLSSVMRGYSDLTEHHVKPE